MWFSRNRHKDESEHGQPKVASNKTGLDAATAVEIQHHFNELRRELLNDQAKTLDRWLHFVGIFLTALGIFAVLFGYIGFERFEKIEDDARQYADDAQRYVEKIKEKSDEATLLVKDVRELTAEAVGNDPKKAGETAERVQANPESSPIGQAIAAAILLQRDKKIEQAIKKWRSIANVVEETDTELGSHAWFSAGYLYGERDDFEAAIADYDEAIQLNPKFSEAYYNRGNAKNNLGQSEAAIVDYNTAIQLNPKFARAYYNRGNAKNNLGQHEAAIADYDEAIRIDPNYTEAYNNRGHAKDSLGQSEAAIADYNTAIQLNPNDADAYYNRGITNKRLGRVNEARQDFDTAINLFRNAGKEDLATEAEQQLSDLDNP